MLCFAPCSPQDQASIAKVVEANKKVARKAVSHARHEAVEDTTGGLDQAMQVMASSQEGDQNVSIVTDKLSDWSRTTCLKIVDLK